MRQIRPNPARNPAVPRRVPALERGATAVEIRRRIVSALPELLHRSVFGAVSGGRIITPSEGRSPPAERRFILTKR